MTDINYHLELEYDSAKSFMTFVDLQILLKVCAAQVMKQEDSHRKTLLPHAF